MARDGSNKEKSVRCSFCNKAQGEVRTLVAGPGGTVYVSGKSIASRVSHYGSSSENPETRLKRINRTLDATEMVIDEEKGKTKRIAVDMPLSPETPIYFRTNPNDERIWCLYLGE